VASVQVIHDESQGRQVFVIGSGYVDPVQTGIQTPADISLYLGATQVNTQSDGLLLQVAQDGSQVLHILVTGSREVSKSGTQTAKQFVPIKSKPSTQDSQAVADLQFLQGKGQD
jgi:hypothetical protein